MVHCSYRPVADRHLRNRIETVRPVAAELSTFAAVVVEREIAAVVEAEFKVAGKKIGA